MKKVAILQSNYIPWKGYFDLIAAVDEFIFYDEVQYTKNDWRNRNKIKTPSGSQWITVPVGQNINRKIKEVTLTGDWQVNHWKSLELNYKRSKYFEEVEFWLKPMYLENRYQYLSEMNQVFIKAICNYLEINTLLSNSNSINSQIGQTERLVDICLRSNSTVYVSGPAAQKYINESLFEAAGVKLQWFDYYGYPEYPQLWGSFQHEVTILDLLFNCGKRSGQYMRYLPQ